jgi:hypothetical protein
MSQSNSDLRWLHQNLRPSTPCLGLSGGIGPVQGGPGCPPMSKAQLLRLRADGMPRPNAFTGVWGGVHYYKGKVWEGPTNRVGEGQLVIVERTGGGASFGVRGIGQ